MRQGFLRLPRRDQPSAILRRAEQRREAGRRVEARQAEPVDRAVAADQSRRHQIADQTVILDRFGATIILIIHGTGFSMRRPTGQHPKSGWRSCVKYSYR